MATIEAYGFPFSVEFSGSISTDSEAAARALGTSERVIAYHERARRPLPRMIALACEAIEARRVVAKLYDERGGKRDTN